MKLQYAVWLAMCCAGFTGCANIQNKLHSNGIGSAASMPPPPPSLGGPLDLSASPAQSPQNLDLSAPAPNAPSLTVTEPPVSGSGSEISSLPSSSSDEGSHKSSSEHSSSRPGESSRETITRKVTSRAKPDHLYNMGSGSTRHNATLSKLASHSKSDESESSHETAPASAKTSEKLHSSANSTITKLNLAATKDESPRTEIPARATEKASSSADKVLPEPSARAADAAPAASTGSAASAGSAAIDADSALLATPVRKGAGRKSDGPQSSLPAHNKFGKPNKEKSLKSDIMPVSNPMDEEPVDTKRFS